MGCLFWSLFSWFSKECGNGFFRFWPLSRRIGRGGLSLVWYNFREFMGEKKGLALIYEGIAAFALPQGMLVPAKNEETG